MGGVLTPPPLAHGPDLIHNIYIYDRLHTTRILSMQIFHYVETNLKAQRFF